MISHYLLPHILNPTRVTDHSASIIDNIFSNCLESDTVSGNLLSQISDNFAQFLIIKNTKLITDTALFSSMIAPNLLSHLLSMIL